MHILIVIHKKLTKYNIHDVERAKCSFFMNPPFLAGEIVVQGQFTGHYMIQQAVD